MEASKEYYDRSAPREGPIKKRPAIFNKIGEIEPQKHYNLAVKVVKVENHLTLKRVEGEAVKIAICLVGDETGCARLMLKDKQCVFAEVNAVLNLRNAQARIAKDKLRLEVTIWGKVEKADVIYIPAYIGIEENR